MLSNTLLSFWNTSDIWRLKKTEIAWRTGFSLSLCQAILYPARIHPPCFASPLTKSVSSLTTHWQAPSFSIIQLSILIFRAAAKLVSDLDASLWVAVDHLSLVATRWHKKGQENVSGIGEAANRRRGIASCQILTLRIIMKVPSTKQL